jgi:hypothetical protein
MPEPPVDESEPGPPRPLSDFMSPERFAEFNAETRRLKRELAREEETVPAPPIALNPSGPRGDTGAAQRRISGARTLTAVIFIGFLSPRRTVP